MSSHIFSLITRATLAIVKQVQLDADDVSYAQATIEAEVSARHPIKTLAQLLET